MDSSYDQQTFGLAPAIFFFPILFSLILDFSCLALNFQSNPRIYFSFRFGSRYSDYYLFYLK